MSGYINKNDLRVDGRMVATFDCLRCSYSNSDEGNIGGTSSVLDFQRFDPARVPNAEHAHALCI